MQFPCVPGTFAYSTRSNTCQDCAIDFFANRTEMVECIECPIGKQATYPGAAACQQCQAGEYGEDCDKCAPGQYREGDDNDASICDLCVPGKHQNAAGQAACLPCVPVSDGDACLPSLFLFWSFFILILIVLFFFLTLFCMTGQVQRRGGPTLLYRLRYQYVFRYHRVESLQRLSRW